MPKTDVLIIGQGLAGTTLAFSLIERGLSVSIIDDHHASAASLVGVAVINPITGRRYAKSWNIDELLPFAIEYYQHISGLLGTTYHEETSLCQILPDARVEEIWMLRAGDPEFREYLDPKIQTLSIPGIEPMRYAHIINAIHLQVSSLIADARKFFENKGLMINESFDLSDLNIGDDDVMYRGNTYSQVTFCPGHRVIKHPLFDWLELYPMKGEYLICRIADLELTEHLKSGISIIPMREKDMYWCGATYDRYENDPRPSDAGREYVMSRVREVVTAPLTIEQHRVGIRATTRDRRPYVGTHPVHSQVHLIAGLGTKGASLAPFCAELLADLIVDDVMIPHEVDILRHSRR